MKTLVGVVQRFEIDFVVQKTTNIKEDWVESRNQKKKKKGHGKRKKLR